MVFQENVPLAPLTTLGVGGPARYFTEAHTEAELAAALQQAHSMGVPVFVMGYGSNLLVSDRGFDGLVLKVALTGCEQRPDVEGHVTFDVAAGEDWDAFVARTVAANCAGLECLSGIPGSTGGTPVQNVGAYGQEVSETITRVDALEIATRQGVSFTNADCSFAYRASRFNTCDRGRYVITRVRFQLRLGDRPSLRYADLRRHFAGHRGQPSLADVREAVREIRQRKAMLIVPGEEDARSAGSFFKNPVVPQRQFEELSVKLAAGGLQLPSYPAGENARKLPAAWLLEHAGFAKGYTKGEARISRRHTLALVNRGGATAADIVALKDEIQARVLSEFGIALQAEPVFLGF